MSAARTGAANVSSAPAALASAASTLETSCAALIWSAVTAARGACSIGDAAAKAVFIAAIWACKAGPIGIQSPAFGWSSSMKKVVRIGAAFMALLFVSTIVADAGARAGSRRYGGVNSHGKYSHYR